MAKRKTSTALRDLNNREHVLYRFWNAEDVLLYVGISVDSPTRIANHMRDKSWFGEVDTIKLIKFATRAEALAAEAEMIRTLKPLYNVVHNEMVEDEDDDEEIDWRRELEVVILGDFDADERDQLLESSRVDWEGVELDDEGQQTHAALEGASRIHRQRRRVVSMLLDFQRLLLDDRRVDIDSVRASLAPGAMRPAFDADLAIEAFAIHLRRVAAEYLATLAPDAAEAWRRRASNCVRPRAESLDRIAARHATWWYGEKSFHVRGCRRVMPHGALCDQLVGAKVWYEICPECAAKDIVCAGHLLWCVKHTQEAREAGLWVLEDSYRGAFPVARTEAVDPDGLDEALYGKAPF
jgi:predicted GIY-YIG superfamily endonuclease